MNSLFLHIGLESRIFSTQRCCVEGKSAPVNRPSYNQRKAAEVTAYLLSKAPNQREYLILIVKLIYIAERRALHRWGRLITWDRFVSMDNGPVPSQTLNLISGTEQQSEIWDEYISDRSAHRIGLREMPEIEELSQAEIDLLDEVYDEFGALNRWEVVDETHKFPEWTDPQGSALPIELSDILRAGDVPSEQIERIEEEIEALGQARSVLSPA